MSIALVTAIIQLLTLVFKSWTEWDAAKRKANEDQRAGWKEVAKSGDVARINTFIDGMRK